MFANCYNNGLITLNYNIVVFKLQLHLNGNHILDEVIQILYTNDIKFDISKNETNSLRRFSKINRISLLRNSK